MRSHNWHHRDTKISRDYYKKLYVNKMNNIKEMEFLRQVQPSKTKPGRNRKYEQTNHKYLNWNCDLKTSNKQKLTTRQLHRQILSNI